MPVDSISRIFWRSVVISFGALYGARKRMGCGENVTATDRKFISLARATTVRRIV